MTPTQARENGFYWVRTHEGWMPAQWEDGEWWVLGGEMSCDDSGFLEIGPRLEIDSALKEALK